VAGDTKGQDLISSRVMGLEKVFLKSARKNSLLLAKPSVVVA